MGRRVRRKFIAAVLIVFTGFCARIAWSQSGTSTFFAQGIAVYDERDQARSREEALNDLMIQGVTQGIGVFLKPSELVRQNALLKKEILSKPQRYVQSYRILSEQPSGGSYRIQGQVTVAMETLRADLEALSLSVEGTAKPVPVPSPAAGSAPASEGNRRSLPEGLPHARDLLWVVSENWDGTWVVPTSDTPSRTPFHESLLMDAEDYLWTLDVPSQGDVVADASGNVPLYDALQTARARGKPILVMGRVFSQTTDAGIRTVQVNLQIVDVASESVLGSLDHSWPLAGDLNEGIVYMASLVVPRIDALLAAAGERGRSYAVGQVSAVPDEWGAQRQWNVVLRSDHAYSQWEMLEELLRRQSSEVRVEGLELKGGEIRAFVSGVSYREIESLSGVKLRDGKALHVRGVERETRSLLLECVPAPEEPAVPFDEPAPESR